MKCHVQQDEDDEEDQGNEHLEALARPDLKFVLACPKQRVTGWQLHVRCDRGLRPIDVPANIARGRIDVHVASQLSILVAHHRRSGSQRDLRQLPERNLGTQGCLDQHPLQIRETIAETLRVADIDRVALATFDGARDVLPADGRLDHVVHVGDHESVPRNGFTIDSDVGEITLGDAFGVHAARTANAL